MQNLFRYQGNGPALHRRISKKGKSLLRHFRKDQEERPATSDRRELLSVSFGKKRRGSSLSRTPINIYRRWWRICLNQSILRECITCAKLVLKKSKLLLVSNNSAFFIHPSDLHSFFKSFFC